MLRIIGTLPAALLTAALCVNGAFAQDATPADRAQALFQEGLKASEAGRWQEAVNAFRASRSIVDRPSTAYNVANALYRMEQFVDAWVELGNFEARADLAEADSRRANAASLKSEIRTRIALVAVDVLPRTHTATLDGVPLAAFSASIPLSPGRHVFFFAAPGHKTAEVAIDVRAGEERSVVARLESVALAPATQTPSEESVLSLAPPASSHRADDTGSVFSHWGFWAGVGVVVVAGAVAGIVIASSGSGSNGSAPSCLSPDCQRVDFR